MKKQYQTPRTDWIRTESLDLLTASTELSDPYADDIWENM